MERLSASTSGRQSSPGEPCHFPALAWLFWLKWRVRKFFTGPRNASEGRHKLLSREKTPFCWFGKDGFSQNHLSPVFRCSGNTTILPYRTAPVLSNTMPEGFQELQMSSTFLQLGWWLQGVTQTRAHTGPQPRAAVQGTLMLLGSNGLYWSHCRTLSHSLKGASNTTGSTSTCIITCKVLV